MNTVFPNSCSFWAVLMGLRGGRRGGTVGAGEGALWGPARGPSGGRRRGLVGAEAGDMQRGRRGLGSRCVPERVAVILVRNAVTSGGFPERTVRRGIPAPLADVVMETLWLLWGFLSECAGLLSMRHRDGRCTGSPHWAGHVTPQGWSCDATGLLTLCHRAVHVTPHGCSCDATGLATRRDRAGQLTQHRRVTLQKPEE